MRGKILKALLPLALIIIVHASANAQKRPIEVEDLPNFRHIALNDISEDGKWVFIVSEDYHSDGDKNGISAPYSGEATLRIYSSKGHEAYSSSHVSRFNRTRLSPFVIFSTKIPVSTRDSILLAKQNAKDEKQRKKDDMPMDVLHVLTLKEKPLSCLETFSADSLRTVKFSKDTDMFAYQTGRKDSTLYLMAGDRRIRSFEKVCSYEIGSDGTLCIADSAAVLAFKDSRLDTLYHMSGKEKVGNMAISDDGTQIAFTVTKDKETISKLMLSTGRKAASEIGNIPSGESSDLVLTEKASLSFSDSSSRLFFTLSEKERAKDSLTLESNRADVEIWGYRDPLLYTVQNARLASDRKRAYMCVYDIAGRKTVLLQKKKMKLVLPGNKDGRWALGSFEEQYTLPSLWEGANAADYYAVDLATGKRYPLSMKDYSRIELSYSGEHAISYSQRDSTWYSFDLATQKRHVLASPKDMVSWDEEDDHPDFPPSYGCAGFTKNEEAVLLYDRYDIYMASLDGSALRRLTPDGRERRISYRLMRLESARELRKGALISLEDTQYLLGEDERTRSTAYYSADLAKGKVKRIYGGDFSLSRLKKAENANAIIFSWQTYRDYPDIRISDLSMKKEVRLSHEGDQEKPFIWGYAEKIEWTSYKGRKLEGVLYYPEDFDQSRKYPMIVNFYERNSSAFHNHHLPNPQRSTLDYHSYNSKGYIIFNPDVRYTDGHPGESCYDCVMSGIDKVIEMGFVDEKRIGAGGHSWGGFQTAYLATRTDRFRCIESGAAVVDMFSAYGGIRWATGLARSFQYEKGQSRLGTTMWEHPEIYAENSPLLNLDKVTTPILIMQNDSDGHVPWYQGIEFYVAMRRLGKPCWLLNYRNEPHWPVKLANRLDFNRRMEQFFGHYLKDEPAPRWMTEGIRAIDRPYDLGY